MKILLVGNGGRENALAWKIYNSETFLRSKGKLFNTLGNPGINQFAEPIQIKPTDIKSLGRFALNEKVDLTVVGPEVPLSMGIVNEFQRCNLKIFGPDKAAAEIESSKVFAKKLMQKNNIPTASHHVLTKDDFKKNSNYFSKSKYPVVVKADGLAAGKGVFIVTSFEEAKDIIEKLTVDKLLGEAGLSLVIEEYLEGEEVSVFVVTDGIDYRILPFSQDHKKICDGDMGVNTGGMGAIAPVQKFNDDALKEKIKYKIIEPVLRSMESIGRPFKGCLYCGLMIVNSEPFVIEFNCRFGDPETQGVLPLIKSDFLEMLISSTSDDIKNYNLEINDDYTCCVVLASDGYPDTYEIDKTIEGIDQVGNDCLLFHSGTKVSRDDKHILSNGGRVLSVVGRSNISLQAAIETAYSTVNNINFENKYYRKDIGLKHLRAEFRGEAI